MYGFKRAARKLLFLQVYGALYKVEVVDYFSEKATYWMKWDTNIVIC